MTAANALQCYRDSICILQSSKPAASIFGGSFALQTVLVAERTIVDTFLELAGCGILRLEEFGIDSEISVSVTAVPWPYIPIFALLCQGNEKITEHPLSLSTRCNASADPGDTTCH